MNENLTQQHKRKGRGPGKKPRLFLTSIRLSWEVINYFNNYHPRNKQAQMRAVLTEYVRDEIKLKEPQHGTQKTFNE